MIRLDNVSKFYYSKGVISTGFSRVNLDFKIGEFVAITGESGSGKSTLLNVISGLDTYEEGEMYIDGKETSHYTEKDFENYRRRYIGNIFQSFNLVNSYTVYQNIELVLLLNGSKSKDVKGRVNELIEKVGLSEYKNIKASKLSGGQKQRVAIARALAKETPIIIADEPTGNLDSESAAEIIELLANISKDKLVIVVTHNYDQVEPYVTRKIKMHDGKVLEDLKLRETPSDIVAPETSFKNIRFLSQVKLGVRNAFNIPMKFILLTFVFLFIAVALTTEISAFKNSEYENSIRGYNYYFTNNASTRIVVKKNDKSGFTQEEFEKMEKLPNVDYVIHNDLFVDNTIWLEHSDLGISALPTTKEDGLLDKVDIGTMPKEKYDIALITDKNSFILSKQYEKVNGSIIGKELNATSFGIANPLKITGVKFYEDANKAAQGLFSDGYVYLSPEILDAVSDDIFLQSSTITVSMNDKIFKYSPHSSSTITVLTSDMIPEGQAFVVPDVAEMHIGYNNDGSLKKKKINVKVSNIYFEDSFDTYATKVLNENNFKKYTGLGKADFQYYRDAIFVSAKDFNRMFDKPSYQSSVFVEDPLAIRQVENSLEKMGMDPLVISDTNANYGDGIIYKFMSTAVTIALAIVLFFVSYFVIRIILKSRNVYYSTVRMLGANVSVARNLLMIDLFTDANIACVTAFLLFSSIIKKWPENAILHAIGAYITVPEMIGIYALVIFISLLASFRYANRLFKKSAMNTYREEV